MESSSLFERLGGSEKIAQLVDDIAAAHVENPKISARFMPLTEDPEHFAEVKQHLSYFLEMGSGGPQRYSGRSMPDAHKGMNISDEEYWSAVDDIMATLEKHGIEESARKDVLFISYALRPEIVGL